MLDRRSAAFGVTPMLAAIHFSVLRTEVLSFAHLHPAPLAKRLGAGLATAQRIVTQLRRRIATRAGRYRLAATARAADDGRHTAREFKTLAGHDSAHESTAVLLIVVRLSSLPPMLSDVSRIPYRASALRRHRLHFAAAHVL